MFKIYIIVQYIGHDHRMCFKNSKYNVKQHFAMIEFPLFLIVIIFKYFRQIRWLERPLQSPP